MKTTKTIFYSVIFFLFPLLLSSGNPVKHHIIIDTDCAPDDLRAINLILSSDLVEVLAITSEDGTLEPEDGYIKINTLLNELGHQGIPSAQGILTKNQAPEWREIARSVHWGKEIISYDVSPEVKEFLIHTIESESEPVEILCLGPLTNIANAILMKPSIKKQIKRIIWFDQCQPDSEWTNYGMDCLSGDYLLNTKIPLYRIKSGKKPGKLTPSFLDEIGKLNNPYAQNIYRSHSRSKLHEKMKEEHLSLWDDLAALYLLKPEAFERDTTMADSLGTIMTPKKNAEVQKVFLEALGKTKYQGNVAFSSFPTDTTLYKRDIKKFADSTLKNYGLKEWKAVVMTNEIHNHLGLYSIIGAKMGIRALEYFHTHPDHLEITSNAGYKPPLSCMNDGVQIASGSTVGNGSFKIVQDNTPSITVVFDKRKKIKIRLKTEYYNKIQQAIIQAKNKYNNSTQGYWNAMRTKGLEFWANWDRKIIFDIEKIE